jgi:hypothetical protein
MSVVPRGGTAKHPENKVMISRKTIQEFERRALAGEFANTPATSKPSTSSISKRNS